MSLNLARDPFLNLRPVRRAGVVLAVLGLVLAAVDARTYWRHFTGENQTRVRLQELDAELAAEREELARLRGQLAGLEVRSLNRRVRFVNRQIAQRTFSWSALFDDLVSIQPYEVQIVTLNPKFESGRRSQRDLDLAPGEVLLEIDGLARSGERLLALVDAFFTHHKFRSPDLQREALREGLIDFTLAVIYNPFSEPPPAPGEAAEAAAPEATAAEGATASAGPDEATAEGEA